jgi:hypothetical protein
MTASTPPATGRVDVITDLLRSLENLVVEYAALPDDERAAHLARNADRITGEVGRQLHVARVRLATSRRPHG